MTEKRLPAFATENDIGWRWISSRPAYAFVGVVTLVAAILRLLYLGKESLWGDEAFTVALASIPLPTMLKLLATDEPNIALYVLMLRGWLALGDSESTIRLLSVVFAAATVPLLYCVARRLAGQPVALLTILLFAVNAWAIRYAQEARGYTLWMMLILASWLFFLRSLERPTRWNLGGYIAASALGLYAHFFAVMSFAAQWIAVLLCARRETPWRPMVASAAAIAVLGAPIVLATRLGYAGQLDWIPPTSFQTIQVTLYSFCGSVAGGRFATMLPLLCVTFWAVGFLALSRESRKSALAARNLALIVLGAALPVAIVFGVSIARPSFIPRYLFQCLPFFSILVAAGLWRMRPRWIGAAALLAILCLSLYQDYRYYQFYLRDDWRGATEYILSNAKTGDGIVTYDSPARWPYDYYASNFGSPAVRPDLIFPQWDNEFRVGGLSYPFAFRKSAGREAVMMRALDGAASVHPRIWLILYHNEIPAIGTDAGTERLLAALNQHYRMTAGRDFEEIRVLLFERAGNAPLPRA